MNLNKFQLYTLTFLIFFVCKASASESNMAPGIELVSGRLSINVKDITLGTIFEKLHKETGIEFVLSKNCAEIKVTAELQAVPLRKALRILLEKLNYATIETDVTIEGIIVLGKKPSPIISHINKLSTPSYSGDTIVESMQINANNTNAIPEDMGLKPFRTNSTPDGMKNNPSFNTAISEGMGIKTSSSNEVPEGMGMNMLPTHEIPDGMSIETTPIDVIPDSRQIQASSPNNVPDYVEIKTSVVNSIREDKGGKEYPENTIPVGIEVGTSLTSEVPSGMAYAPANASNED